MDRGIMIF